MQTDTPLCWDQKSLCQFGHTRPICGKSLCTSLVCDQNKPFCCDGPRHLWKLVSSTRYLPDNLRGIVDGVISHSGFFAHRENILSVMPEDERPCIREISVCRALGARSSVSQNAGIRQFRVPRMYMEATDYPDIMILTWQEEPYLEPPVLKDIPEEALWHTIQQTTPVEARQFHFPIYPCHTQAIEHGIKLVTEASSSVIKARIASRKATPTFKTKSDYQPD